MPIGKYRFTLEAIMEAMEECIGFCTVCGSERECCEPDACDYPCEECGENSVYGAEELLIIGLVDEWH